MQVVTIPALSDNYIWLGLSPDGSKAFVVDPGESAPVLDTLKRLGTTLAHILVTHHHPDHVGGVAELHAATGAAVTVPAESRYTFPEARRVSDGEQLDICGYSLAVLAVPGHTLDHIAYCWPGSPGEAPALFCGDTLFAGGCGRLFEGSAAQMHASLARIRALPSTTRIYCAHEYTASNLAFARLVEPDNTALAARVAEVAELRASGQPTVPSSLAVELLTNPFLRWDAEAVKQAVFTRLGHLPTQDAEIFGAIRAWKDIA